MLLDYGISYRSLAKRGRRIPPFCFTKCWLDNNHKIGFVKYALMVKPLQSACLLLWCLSRSLIVRGKRFITADNEKARNCELQWETSNKLKSIKNTIRCSESAH